MLRLTPKLKRPSPPSAVNEKTGSIDLFAVKKVVEAVQNPATELTLLEARRIGRGQRLHEGILAACVELEAELAGQPATG